MLKPVVASYCTTFLKAEMLHIYRQVTSLQEFRTFVVTKERLNADRYPFSDIELLPCPKSNFVRRFWLKYIRNAPPILYRGEFQVLHKVLQLRDPDLMHIYFGHTAVHLVPFLEIWEKPAVVSFHGMDVQLRAGQPEYPQQMKKMLQLVQLALVRSESLRDRVIDLGCDPSKVRINRTGIPLHHFPRHERAAPADDAWHFVQACRLIPKKGICTALSAFARVAGEFPKARFTLAGEGPMLGEIKEFLKREQLQDRVTLKGFLGQEELNALYQTAHVFVHPSEMTSDQNQEGIPNSMLEAMSTGLPVLATLHGGIPEAVTDGQNGFLVEERDAEGLADRMLRIMRQPELWKDMGLRASNAMAENFEQRKQIARLEGFYREAMEAAPARRALALH
jgi:colanic acid/amylovoran biosynthesis glycosyltransferase